MYRRILALARRIRNYLQLPMRARTEGLRDWKGLPIEDPGIDCVVNESLAWLYRAQDNSATHDGGVARHFSLVSGWGSSYPETTGYIIPTLLTCSKVYGNSTAAERARKMLDWLLSIQLSSGAFQGGCVDQLPVVPVTFNTGQILLGLAAGTRELGEGYRHATVRAADWLVETQDADGCWRAYPTPFAKPGEKAYETHVAWALLEAHKVDPNRAYADAALANVRWALTKQEQDGWVQDCCLSDSSRPLTHTLGYFLRGVIEAYRYSGERELLEAAKLTADGLLRRLGPDGYLAGRFAREWCPAVTWVCLTGSAQIAHCWLLLYILTKDHRYRNAGFLTNQYIRRTIRVNGRPETRGAVKGPFPISGDYGKYEYLNWATKFSVDSNMLEQQLRANLHHDVHV